jgi:AdoMet-dependent rRNA methyltransferase SPB1
VAADYNALMWVFQQLFKKVEATKPASSRNVSAEIFVVCRDYLAPDKIDPRLLDARSVFEQVDGGKPDPDKPLSLGKLFDDKNAQRRFRSGYDESKGQVLFTRCPAADFVLSPDPVRVLTETNELSFENDGGAKLLAHAATTPEIRALCADLKVVGKSDFRQLLRWRALVRPVLAAAAAAAAGPAAASAAAPQQRQGQEEEENMMADALSLAEQRRKREDKRERREQAKKQRKKDMGLVHAYALVRASRRAPAPF